MTRKAAPKLSFAPDDYLATWHLPSAKGGTFTAHGALTVEAGKPPKALHTATSTILPRASPLRRSDHGRRARGGASLCGDHYREKGSGTLGSGDAYLMLDDEVSESVRSTCNEISSAQGKDPLY